jgi:hypothetical protein
LNIPQDSLETDRTSTKKIQSVIHKPREIEISEKKIQLVSKSDQEDEKRILVKLQNTFNFFFKL